MTTTRLWLSFDSGLAEALRAEARRHGRSLSALTAEMVLAGLDSRTFPEPTPSASCWTPAD